MKRIFTAFLAVLLLLPLAACGDREPVRLEKAGTTVLYSEPVEEGKKPQSYFSVPMSAAECEAIREMLNGASWQDDNAADREPFFFDGSFSFAGEETVYYFSFDACVIYYDHFYAVVSEEAIGLFGS